MAVEVVMPKFGLTMQEGTIQQWFKAEGDPVREGDPLYEVETEKVLYEVEAPADGVLARILYPPEATVACGHTVAVIATAGEDAAAVAARFAAASAPAPAARAASAPAPGAPPPQRSAPAAPVTPAARKLAREHQLDLAHVIGTGPGGRVTREDVEQAIAQAALAPIAAAPAEPRTAPGDAAAGLRGMRKTIAERMVRSLQSTAQLTITTETDVTATVARRERLGAEFSLTYTDLVCEAVISALRAHPRLNATVEGEVIRGHTAIHLGIAVAVDDGLIVPVIRHAEAKTLAELAAASRLLAEKARAGKLTLDDVADGTFTITNLGAYGIDAFTPIINPPQVAILGVGRVVDKPVIHAGEIVPRAMMVLSLTFDHRVIDGAPAAAFLQSVAAALGRTA